VPRDLAAGETSDTLAAVKVVKARGARAFWICNVVGAAIPRESNCGTLVTRAGPGIGVAATRRSRPSSSRSTFSR
jgi:glutamine---fructose-6-phosphate transaminase (isomerizing)